MPRDRSAFEYDLAVVGSGSGAFAAAIAARRRDLRVVVVERGVIGGTCVNVGCIPSKALLAAAGAQHRAAHGRFPGVQTTAGPVDLAGIVAAKDEIVTGLRESKYIGLADEYGIDLLEGEARFVDGPALEVDGRRIEAEHYLVATGAEPYVPHIPGLRDSGYLTSTTSMELEVLPESLVVIGGGYVGMEQAQLFGHLGSEVTMLVRSQLAPGEEPEVQGAIRDALARDGIAVHEGLAPDRVRRGGAGVIVEAKGTQFVAQQLLVATGRRPRTDGLGLREIGLEVGSSGELVVDDRLRTSNPRVWGAGDVTGHPQFVNVAARHGGMVVENAFEDAGRRVDYSALPRMTFTSPTIARAGSTEAQARDRGLDCESRVLSLEHVPRAIVDRSTAGLVKVVAERGSGRVVGVHIVGDGAGDVILAGSLAIQAGMTVEELAAGWDPYLTLGEGLHLAAQAFHRDPSKLSCCAA